MENQVLSKIVAISDATLITNIGRKLMLKDVRNVQYMRLNLTSVGKLDDFDLVNHFGGGIWKLTKGSLIITKGKKRKAPCNLCKENFARGSLMLPMTTQIWSYDLEDSNISEKRLQILARKELIPHIKGKLFEPCIHCLASKQHREAFYKNV